MFIMELLQSGVIVVEVMQNKKMCIECVQPKWATEGDKALLCYSIEYDVTIKATLFADSTK